MTHTKKYNWQSALSHLVTEPRELLELLNLSQDDLPLQLKAALSFPLKIPRRFLSRIEKGNPNDPLLLQLLPSSLELNHNAHYIVDPLSELTKNPLPGLLHKYHGRVLVTLTSSCAVHCRYCFRRHFPYQDNLPGSKGFKEIIDYIKNEKSISEIILSGGDPLTLNDHTLKKFSDQLIEIPHLKTYRIHSRVPVVLPERITPDFLTWIASLPWQVVLVIHANHAREIDEQAKAALLELKKHGVILLNQSVLLRGVNDDVDTLVALSHTLFEAGVLPYYLHLLDKVAGAAHFDIPLVQACRIHTTLANRLPGYLVPRLASEVAGLSAKKIVS